MPVIRNANGQPIVISLGLDENGEPISCINLVTGEPEPFSMADYRKQRGLPTWEELLDSARKEFKR